MIKKSIMVYVLAFLVTMILAGGITAYAQTGEESKEKATPTPTRMPSKAPSTGLGGGW